MQRTSRVRKLRAKPSETDSSVWYDAEDTKQATDAAIIR